MSYAVTDAGEQDMRAELKALDAIQNEIDQLHSDAGACGTVAPEVKTLLGLAWWFCEHAYRDTHGHCSVGCHGAKWCDCCELFKKLAPRAQSLKGKL